MHQSTQRALCRLAFLAVGVAPLLMVAWSILSLNWPGRLLAHEQRLSKELDLLVRLGDVSYPQPGVTRYTDVELGDRETHERVARIRLLEVEKSGNRLKLIVREPELETRKLDELWRLLEERALRQSPLLATDLEIDVGQVTLAGGTWSQTLVDVVASVQAAPESRVAQCQFKIAGVAMKEPATFRVVRLREHVPPLSRMELETGPTPLPLQAFRAFFSAADSAGSSCLFRGQIQATHTDAGWAGQLTGEFQHIDLQRLVGSNFPQKLSGPANVLVDAATWEDSRITSAQGEITAGPGVVGEALLLSAQENLPGSLIDGATGDSMLRYRQLAAKFAIDADGLTLEGHADGPRGTLISGEGGWHLRRTILDKVPAVVLVRTLAPNSDTLVPASPETEKLLRLLPLPPLTSAGETAPGSHLRVRDSDTDNEGPPNWDNEQGVIRPLGS